MNEPDTTLDPEQQRIEDNLTDSQRQVRDSVAAEAAGTPSTDQIEIPVGTEKLEAQTESTEAQDTTSTEALTGSAAPAADGTGDQPPAEGGGDSSPADGS